jgi:hypothetical protein
MRQQYIDAKKNDLLDPATKEDRLMTKKDIKDLGLDSLTVNSAHINEFIELCWVDPFKQEKLKENAEKKQMGKDLDFIDNL